MNVIFTYVGTSLDLRRDFFFLSKLCMMAHAYSASSQETEARGWLELAGPTQKSIIIIMMI